MLNVIDTFHNLKRAKMPEDQAEVIMRALQDAIQMPDISQLATREELKSEIALLRTDMKGLATKEELAEVKADIAEVKADMKGLATKEELAEVKADIAEVKADMKGLATKEELAEVKADMKGLATKKELAEVKQDIALLRIDIIKANSDQLKWLMGIVFGSNAVFLSAALVLKLFHL